MKVFGLDNSSAEITRFIKKNFLFTCIETKKKSLYIHKPRNLSKRKKIFAHILKKWIILGTFYFLNFFLQVESFFWFPGRV